MYFKKIIVFILLFILVYSTAIYALSIDEVKYSIRGDLNELETLELRLGTRIDNINSPGLTFIHDGDNFKFQGDWQIEFFKRADYKINLAFILPFELNNFSAGKGIGFSGENILKNSKRFYWSLSYFFDRNEKDNWVYEGGIIYPVRNTGSVIIGLGNTYWNSDNNLYLGFKVDI